MSGASQVVAMALNGHHTDAMHYHYSTVNESEVRDVLSRTVKLMGMDQAEGPIGGEIGGKATGEGVGETGQRRESGEETTKGNFSVGSVASWVISYAGLAHTETVASVTMPQLASLSTIFSPGAPSTARVPSCDLMDQKQMSLICVYTCDATHGK